jgi:hypothetical protein
MNGELLYICSRCGQCYVCKHTAVHFTEEDVWRWKRKNGKYEEVINDGRMKA